MTIDINCDMGESFGHYRIGNDAAIMPYISSCNVACGFHAGDPFVILNTLKKALDNKLAIGAHPSYPDLQGFGRRKMSIPLPELSAIITYQISAMKGMVESLGGQLSHVKPHGALYNDIAQSEILSNMVIETIQAINPSLHLVGSANSITETLCIQKGLPFIGEFFADRNYLNDGSLVPRSEPNASLETPELIAKRAKDFVLNGIVKSIDLQDLHLEAQTICLHGDNPNVLSIAQEIKKTFSDHNIDIKCV